MTATIRDVYGDRSPEFEAFRSSNKGTSPRQNQSQSVALGNLIDLDKIFVDCSVKYVLLYGTLLGAAREGNIIEYDTDVDVGVFVQSEAKLLEALRELEKIGLRVIRVSGPKHWLTDFVSVGRDGEYIDISVLRFRRVAGLTWVGQTAGWSQARDFFPVKKLNLGGFYFPAPKKFEKLLKQWYGRSWMTPQVGKRANHHRKFRNLLRNLSARIASCFRT